MTIDRWVLLFAGTTIIVSLILSQLHSVWWLALAALMGLNLMQASVTRFCPLAVVLKKLGTRAGPAFG